MKKNLMYGEAPDLNGWGKTAPLVDERIDKDIKDQVNQSAAGAKEPRTSVPSPFARFELVKKAFESVSKKNGDADKRDLRLVSNALDALQLFYEGSTKISIVEWKKSAALSELANSCYDGHKLVGDTLTLYMRQEDFGFNEAKHYNYDLSRGADDMSLYFLTYEKLPLAITSPTSVFMATPDYNGFGSEITIEGSKPLFGDSLRPFLTNRDKDFVVYIYRLIYYWSKIVRGKKDILNPLKAFRDYLEAQKEMIRKQQDKDLIRDINSIEDMDERDLMTPYQEPEETSVNLMGLPLFVRRKENVQEQIEKDSDFVIKSTRSLKKPLVLTNNLNAAGWRYTSLTTPWDLTKNAINYKNRRDRKFLPGTDIEYEHGWLCETDFLSDILVELPYALNSAEFFDGNISGTIPECTGFLPPVTEKFFEFFTIDYLMGKDGRDPNFKMEVRRGQKDKFGNIGIEVVVTLRIPVQNSRTVVLKKIYSNPEEPDNTYGLKTVPDSESEARGYIVKTPLEVSVFPFVKLPQNNHYIIQMMRNGWDEYDCNLTALYNGKEDGDNIVDWPFIEATRPSKSKYYTLKNEFDYIFVNISNPAIKVDGKARTLSALLIPLFKEYVPGNKQLRFAFDFGTSNSHIAVRNAEGDKEFIDFTLKDSVGSTMPNKTPMPKNPAGMLSMTLFNLRYKQEFLPKEGLGENYTFPMSTVLLKPNTLVKDSPLGLRDMNIPFIYGKEDYNEEQNSIASNLKWSDEEDSPKGYANAYIEELILLARAFAIEQNADLSKCELNWTYPLSMKKGDVSDFDDKWRELYRLYFNKDTESADSNVKKITESVAPLLYYYDNKKANDLFNLSIDIGGGTCDVVICENRDSQRITSFRFGAENIFGVGNNQNVPMISSAFNYFIKKFTDITNNPDSEIVKELNKFSSKTAKASEATGRLFGLESHRLIKKVDLADKSFNVWLSGKKEYKLIFVYYYAAIIYYLTKLLQANGFEKKPQCIFFSGTGSKLLNIIGGNARLRELTSMLIEKFSEGQYSYPNEMIAITIESKEPKQLTAKGALFVDYLAQTVADKTRRIEELRIYHPMCPSVEKQCEAENKPKVLTYSQLEDTKVLSEIVESVDQFNRQFYKILIDYPELIRVDDEMLDTFESKYIKNTEVNEKLLGFINTVIGRSVKKDVMVKNAERAYEDIPFFYPVKMIIESLLKNED